MDGDCYGRQRQELLASVAVKGDASRDDERLVEDTGAGEYPQPLDEGSRLRLRTRVRSVHEPPGADPHAGWCGEGRLDAGPYPIGRRVTFANGICACFHCGEQHHRAKHNGLALDQTRQPRRRRMPLQT